MANKQCNACGSGQAYRSRRIKGDYIFFVIFCPKCKNEDVLNVTSKNAVRYQRMIDKNKLEIARFHITDPQRRPYEKNIERLQKKLDRELLELPE